MPVVNVPALRELLVELDRSGWSGGAPSDQRVADLLYSISVTLGVTGAREAVERARRVVAADPVRPRHRPAQAALPTGPELHRVLADLAADRANPPRSPGTLDEVVGLTPVLIPSCVAAGVVRWTDDGPVELLAATSPAQEYLDRAQLETGQGPLLEARVSPDQTAGAAFGAFGTCPAMGAAGLRFGVHSGLAVLLRSTAPGHHTALSVYLDSAGAPDAAMLRLAGVQALRAGLALDTSALVQAVAQLLDRRQDTGRAVGILMERYALTPQAAFDLLGRAARSLGSDVPALTARLVAEPRTAGTPADV